MTGPKCDASGSDSFQFHASAVGYGGGAVLVRGASGSGKSTLALQLMAYGAALIADDRTDVLTLNDWPHAACPEIIRGRIEARGIGILSADPGPPTPIVLVVDMDCIETLRMPPERTTWLQGKPIRLLHKVESMHFAPAILLYLKMAAHGMKCT